MMEESHSILIVDDDVAVITSLNLLFKQAGFRSRAAHNPEEASKIIREDTFDLVLLDLNFSRSTTGEEGLAFLKQLKNLLPGVPVILITAWASIPLAVEGMKAGAFDFISKPWDNRHLLNTIRTALSVSDKTTTDTTTVSRQQLDRDFHFENIIGEDPKFLEVLNTISRICKTDAPVLITGESGTGKELIAAAIHENSHRRNNPFVKVNLGGISSTLFESEMFGHKKGAFTDAKSDRVGRFELADTGTIFLDEIGDLDVNCQVKLLRVLQDRKFEVLGSSITKSIDVRVISATNRHLEEMVEKNEFREDLYYRINLITLKLPSLRKRPDDIPLLVNQYVNNLKRIYRREALRVGQMAMNWLKELPWPGNIRELKNLVERTVLVTEKDTLDIDDFSAQFYASPQKSAKDSLPAVGTMTLEEMEAAMIRKALEFYSGNISKVARALGLSRGALYRRMGKFGISE
jgi:DNA-binding NtrC family response regulator